MFKQYLSCDICNPCHRVDSGKRCRRLSISIPSSSVLLCACTCNDVEWCDAVSFDWCHGFKLKSAENYFPSQSPEGTAEVELIILQMCTCSGSRVKISVLKTDVGASEGLRRTPVRAFLIFLHRQPIWVLCVNIKKKKMVWLYIYAYIFSVFIAINNHIHARIRCLW